MPLLSLFSGVAEEGGYVQVAVMRTSEIQLASCFALLKQHWRHWG